MAIRPTLVTVDLAAVRHNLGVAQRLAPGAAMCAIVKANAYGHGLVPIGSVLAEAGAEWLAVALIEEGIALRQAGVKTPLLILGASLEGGYDALIKHDLVPVLFREDQLVQLAKAAGKGRARFHLKVDTGMSRLGLRLDDLASFLTVLGGLPTTELDGVLTHFANADLADREFNEEQLALFRRACQQINAAGHRPRWAHIANSAAVLTFPEAHGKLVRPGLMLYGLDPRESRAPTELRPAMRWTTRPVHVRTIPPGTRVSYGGRWKSRRPSRIATLPVGYADGYPRSLSNKAEVLVCGQRAPVVGTVCMDLCMIDVTDIPGVEVDSEVVLLGSQGNDAITAYELAEWAGTIPYEITCGITKRVPRRYLDGGA